MKKKNGRYKNVISSELFGNKPLVGHHRPNTPSHLRVVVTLLRENVHSHIQEKAQKRRICSLNTLPSNGGNKSAKHNSYSMKTKKLTYEGEDPLDPLEAF